MDVRGFVAADVIASFNRMRYLTQDVNVILYAGSSTPQTHACMH
jgi:hypothetical protein